MIWKNILIGCAIGCVVLVIAAVAGIYALYKFYFAPMIATQMQVPQPVQSPGVVAGSGFLSQSVLLQDPSLGSVTDIVLGELDPAPGLELGIAGSDGAVFLDQAHNVKKSVTFSSPTTHVDIIDVESDGKCEFMNRGHWGCDASLFSHDGKRLWEYGGRPGVNDMCAGDMDGDGKTEFAVGFNGAGGVHLLSSSGHRKWRQPDSNAWHVEMANATADPRPEIIHSNAAAQLTVRDSQGAVMSRTQLQAYFSSFSLCKWPDRKGAECALYAENDTIWLLGFGGNTVARFDAPDCGSLGHARGTTVRLKKDEPEYFAAVVEFKQWARSLLYVYDSAQTLVYQEVLPESSASIAAVALGTPGAEALLVGGDGKVWEYRLKTPTPAKQPP